MERITGLVFSGFAMKAYAAIGGLWLATEVWTYVSGVMTTVQGAF